MEILALIPTELYALVILPVLIFFARVCDVSIGTLRIIFISKGYKHLAPIVGFFEVLIWLLAIGQILQNLTNVYYYIFYAAGFATGNYVGMYLEEKISIGMVGVEIITRHDAEELVTNLKSNNYGVTSVNAEGIKGRVKIIYTVIKRSDLKNVIDIVKKFNPNAFYSIEDIRFVSEAVLPPRKNFFRPFVFWRKGK